MHCQPRLQPEPSVCGAGQVLSWAELQLFLSWACFDVMQFGRGENTEGKIATKATLNFALILFFRPAVWRVRRRGVWCACPNFESSPAVISLQCVRIGSATVYNGLVGLAGLDSLASWQKHMYVSLNSQFVGTYFKSRAEDADKIAKTKTMSRIAGENDYLSLIIFRKKLSTNGARRVSFYRQRWQSWPSLWRSGCSQKKVRPSPPEKELAPVRILMRNLKLYIVPALLDWSCIFCIALGRLSFTFHSSCTHLSVSDTAAGQDGGLCDGVKLKKRAARRWASWRRTSHRRRMRRRCRRWRWPAATWRWTTLLCRTNLHGIKNVSCWCGKTPDWWGGIFAPTKNWLVDKGAWDLFSMKREPISHLPGQKYFLAFEIFLNWNHLHTNEMLPLQTKYWILTRDFKK